MTDLALNGNTVLFTMLILAFSIVGSIIGLRIYWKSKLKTSIARSNNSPLKNTGGLHAFGICIALISAITLMSWTQAEREVIGYTVDTIERVEEDIPITYHVEQKPKPIPPPPKENNIIEAVEDLVEEIEKPKEIPLEVPIDVELKVSNEPTNLPQKAPPAPQVVKPAEKTIDVIEIVSIAERMPRFPGCFQDDLSNEEQAKCTENELMGYVYDNLKYPRVARENGIEGRVILQFVIDTKGNISDINILRDIGAGCGAAASKVVEEMVAKKGLWTPGKQNRRPVNVRYTLPITFALQK